MKSMTNVGKNLIVQMNRLINITDDFDGRNC